MAGKSYAAWLAAELKGLTSADISAAGEGLPCVEPGEEVVGSLEGDHLRSFAVLVRNKKQLLRDIQRHEQAHGKPGETDCTDFRAKIEPQLEVIDLHRQVFWHDVCASLDLPGGLALRAGMKLVKVPHQSRVIEILLGGH